MKAETATDGSPHASAASSSASPTDTSTWPVNLPFIQPGYCTEYRISAGTPSLGGARVPRAAAYVCAAAMRAGTRVRGSRARAWDGRTRMDDEQRFLLDLNGYLHLRSILSPRELAACRAAADRHISLCEAVADGSAAAGKAQPAVICASAVPPGRRHKIVTTTQIDTH